MDSEVVNVDPGTPLSGTCTSVGMGTGEGCGVGPETLPCGDWVMAMGRDWGDQKLDYRVGAPDFLCCPRVS